MQFSKRKVWVALMATSVMPLGAHSSNTEGVYPNKRVTIVIGASPGAGVDILSRRIAMELQQELGVEISIQNRPGASANIAAEQVARSEPDGYTLFIASRSNVTYGAMQEHPRYDLKRDLVPVVVVATTPTVIISGRETMIMTTSELLSRAKTHPMSIKCASGGIGSTGHLVCEEFQQEAKVELLHVPYTYADQAFSHLIGGHIDTIFATLPAALPYIRAGAVHAIAISGDERAPSVPGIPTFREEGFAQLHGDTWFGLVAPSGTPLHIIETLNLSLNRILARPKFREQLLELGYGLPQLNNSATSFEQLISDEISHWTDLIAERGIASSVH
ncbi:MULTISPECIES: tripartite tricarboxylate transporter substrate binding protein [unclassified Achromobacter]|uniref:Bug family tripartite tricarboxylate transporter substrate binding protein n=1 Tax=unclassified Achromobacter TaxID=2626865 RepID=UPI000B5183AC|nr:MULTISPECIES: tripartite tricarboxylate transporter substrate-binding protein [unclassified Achromobacter]OWT80879.1 hypothetical protein CEY05_05790 [Achromobacter sp. HZ34]OWT81395.1 hypothetical protein CEY04_05780 [Achromobacter sp. HZ28]